MDESFSFLYEGPSIEFIEVGVCELCTKEIGVVGYAHALYPFADSNVVKPPPSHLSFSHEFLYSSMLLHYFILVHQLFFLFVSSAIKKKILVATF